MSLSLETLSVNLMACVCAALQAAGWQGECCIEPSQNPALDACCGDGGQAWVALQNIYPSTHFPVSDLQTSPVPCGQVQLVTQWEIGFTICACAGQDDGSPCSCEIREQNAMDVFKYLEATLAGVLCCFSGSDCEDFVISGAAPLPRGGLCAGGTVTLLYGQPMPCCEETS